MITDQQPVRAHETRQQLEAERLGLQREITSYPTPIPACDAYFNHLLEQRARVCDALSRLEPRAPQR